MRILKLKVIILVAVSLLIVGCNQAGDSTDSGGIDPNQSVRLLWWGTVHDEDVMRPLLDEYQQLNPNVTVDYSTARWNRTIPVPQAELAYRQELERVLTNATDVDTPDIMAIDSTWLGIYERFLSPAPTNIYTPETYRAVFHQGVTDNMLVKDPTNNAEKVMGVPLYIDTLGLVYNNSLLSAAGPQLRIADNWSDFQDLAEQLTIRGAGSVITQAGFAGGFGSNVEFSPQLFNLLMLQDGVRVVGTDGLPSFASSGYGVYEFYKSFADNTWSTDVDDFRNDSAAFMEQRLVATVVPSWRYRQMLNLNESLGIDIRVAKLPQSGGSVDTYWATYHANVVAIRDEAANAQAAWGLLAWLARPEQIRKLSENTKNKHGHFGTISPLIEMSSELSGDANLSVFNDMIPNAKSWYMVDGFEVDKIMVAMLDRDAATSNMTTAQEQVTSIFNNRETAVSAQ